MKIKLARKYKVVIAVSLCVLIAAAVVSMFNFTKTTRAEQTGGSPESGETSRIKTIYDVLVGLGFGSDGAGGWGNWGANWNRTYSSALWVPSANAAVTDVKIGKTFNNTSRTAQTGTYANPSSCSTQVCYDSRLDCAPPVDKTTNCVNDIIWSANPGGAVAGEDDALTGGYDPRTGLTWSKYLRCNATVVEFVDDGGETWNWNGDDNAQGVNNKECCPGCPGPTYKTAAQLCSERGHGWRLPTQKELMQAYIDGTFWNLSRNSNTFWALTENSANVAWYVYLNVGFTSNTNKSTNANYIRCAR